MVALRARALKALEGIGGMSSILVSAERAAELIEPWGEKLAVAAVNGPAQVIVSGDVTALDELAVVCENEGVHYRRIGVSYASHHPQVGQLADVILEDLEPVAPKTTEIPFYSTVSGEAINTATLTGDYWLENLRSQVKFFPTVVEALKNGFTHLLEVSPHPVLGAPLEEAAEGRAGAVDAAPGRRGQKRFRTALAELHLHHGRVDWTPVFKGARRVSLPTYAFQHQRYWLEPRQGSQDVATVGLRPAEHGLLGAVLHAADTGATYLSGRLSLAAQPWLADHALGDTVVLAGSAMLEMAVHTGSRLGYPRVDELTHHAPLVIPGDGAVVVQVTVNLPEERDVRAFTLASRAEDEEEWVVNATGLLAPAGADDDSGELATWPPQNAETLSLEDFYETMADVGVHAGPAFQCVGAAWRRGDDVFTELALPQDLHREAGSYVLHPALLDGALQGAWFGVLGDPGQGRGPFSWSGVSLRRPTGTTLRARIRAAGAGRAVRAGQRRNRRRGRRRALAGDAPGRRRVRAGRAAAAGRLGRAPGDHADDVRDLRAPRCRRTQGDRRARSGGCAGRASCRHCRAGRRIRARVRLPVPAAAARGHLGAAGRAGAHRDHGDAEDRPGVARRAEPAALAPGRGHQRRRPHRRAGRHRPDARSGVGPAALRPGREPRAVRRWWTPTAAPSPPPC